MAERGRRTWTEAGLRTQIGLAGRPGTARWNVAGCHGAVLVNRNGDKIGKLPDVYVDIDTDEPQFAALKEDIIGRHLTFVPLRGVRVGLGELQVAVTGRSDFYRIPEHSS